MKNKFPIHKLDNFDTFAFYEDAFSSVECNEIKKLFNDMTDGVVGYQDNVDKQIRKSQVCFKERTDETEWIFNKLTAFAFSCNLNRWRFQLSGFYEGLQLTEYDEHGSHYDWHMDNGNGEMSIRKLSLILLLDDPKDYDGGELGFIGVQEKKKYGMGTLIVFPSYVGHKVYPVTKGNRKTVVAWISGDPYR
jgi:PKHD-type hydroxylase